jgi:hypothetical protein
VVPKGITDTGQYRDIGVIVVAEVSPHAAQLPMHFRCNRILGLRPVQRDIGDSVSDFVSDFDHRSIVRRPPANSLRFVLIPAGLCCRRAKTSDPPAETGWLASAGLGPQFLIQV